jgi:phytoene synthase
MTSAPDRDFTGRLELVARAEALINAGSKSFRFASRLFDRTTRERSWLLYAWCRTCDDLADGQTLGHDAQAPADPAARLALIRRQTERALAGEATGEAAFDALALVVRECGIPDRFVWDHVDGFALDAAGWRPASEADLLRYCYHVAGAVGCMMAVVMGVAPDEEATLDRAADLGIAFQLANIARDLVEDAQVGRAYLPQTWLAEEGSARISWPIRGIATRWRGWRSVSAASSIAIATRRG